MKNILHICPSFDNPLYGLLLDQIPSSDFKNSVYFFRTKGSDVGGEFKYNVKYVEPYSNWQRLFFKIKEKKIYSNFKKNYDTTIREYNMLHAHTLFSSGYVAWKNKIDTGIPYIVACRAVDVNTFFKYRKNLSKIGIEILKESKYVVFISAKHRELVINKYVPKKLRVEIRKKSCVIPNGVNEYWINNASSGKRYEHKIINLIYYGDINRNKNIMGTIKACDILIQNGRNISYTIIGKIHSKKIENVMKKKPYISYYPYMKKEDLREQLLSSDIFVMPSFSETFGLSYIEAMSQGIPIIYSQNQGLDGIYEDGDVGHSVNPKDASDIADKIVYVILNYSKLSKRCTQEAIKYSWQDISKKIIELYELVTS